MPTVLHRLIAFEQAAVISDEFRRDFVALMILQSPTDAVQAHVFIHKENALIKHQMVIGAQTQ